jgi:hypothetical protein
LCVALHFNAIFVLYFTSKSLLLARIFCLEASLYYDLSTNHPPPQIKSDRAEQRVVEQTPPQYVGREQNILLDMEATGRRCKRNRRAKSTITMALETTLSRIAKRGCATRNTCNVLRVAYKYGWSLIFFKCISRPNKSALSDNSTHLLLLK